MNTHRHDHVCLIHRYKVIRSLERDCYQVMLDGVPVGSHAERDSAVFLAIADALSDKKNGIPAAVFLVDENGTEHQRWPGP
jgi:hypothetical protein